MRFTELFTAASLFFLTGCAYVGDPKPPALEAPVRILNLRAAEYGANILTDFTLPAVTTEGLPLKDVMKIELRVTGGGMSKDLSVPTQEPGPAQFDFPARDWVGNEVTLAVRAVGPKGKPSEWSNAVKLMVAPPLATPADLRAVATGEGVRLTWILPGTTIPGTTATAKNVSVFRGMGDMPAVKVGDASTNQYLDATAEFGMPYKYFVQASDGALHQSDASATVSITPVDTFAPAVPKGVSAVAGTGAIELAWERNIESDFAGYNIYRSANGGSFMKIADHITGPAYSDRIVTAGTKYSYAVSSVDQAGNESERSTPVEVTAQ